MPPNTGIPKGIYSLWQRVNEGDSVPLSNSHSSGAWTDGRLRKSYGQADEITLTIGKRQLADDHWSSLQIEAASLSVGVGRMISAPT